MLQFGLQPLEGFSLRPFLVAADQVADVVADILAAPVLADLGCDELGERTADASGHGRLRHR